MAIKIPQSTFTAEIDGRLYEIRRDHGTLSGYIVTRLNQGPDELLDQTTEILPYRSMTRSDVVNIIKDNRDARRTRNEIRLLDFQ